MFNKIKKGFLSQYELAKLAPRINKQVKAAVSSFDKDEYSSAIESDEKMTAFAEKVFSLLSADIRVRVPKEQFLAMIVGQRSIALKKSKNKKTLKQEIGFVPVA
jgi:hypothetical protein